MSISGRLEHFLIDHNAAYTLQTHRPSTSSLASAHSAHVDEHSVAKSVLLRDDLGALIAVLPASHRLELSRLQDKLGRPFHLCSEREVLELFPDCAPGAVPPIGAAYGLPTVVDSSLEGCCEVYFEGGDHETLVRMEGPGFIDLLEDAPFIEIANESSFIAEALARSERLAFAQRELSSLCDSASSKDERWRSDIKREVAALAQGLAAHTRESEARGGILESIEEQAPRLWRKIDFLREDHEQLADSCTAISRAIEQKESDQQVAARCHGLIERLERHRRRGADLVFQAFGVDLGGG